MIVLYEKIEKIKSFFPLNKLESESVRNFFEVKYNYNSNAIEWTTFTEEEIIEVLKWNTIPFHVIKEHFEVINHKKVFDLIINLSKNKWEDIFNEKNILKIHEIILTNINDDYAWRYRNMNVRISWSNDILPNYMKVQELMEEFFLFFLEEYKNIKTLEDILNYWYKIHLEFVKIHPFIDWNWRTSRFIMNMFFLNQLEIIDVIYMKNRKEYINSISNSKNNIWEYIQFMNNNFEEFLDEFLELLENKIYYKL